jgi:hypothetical protein
MNDAVPMGPVQRVRELGEDAACVGAGQAVLQPQAIGKRLAP